MKSILITLAVLLLGVTVIVIANRSYQVPPTTEVVLLRDVTEKLEAKPKADRILKLYDFSAASRWNGARFIYSNVTDVSYNEVKEVRLEPANKWLSNELQRDKEVSQFQTGFSKIIDNGSRDTIGRKHSSVYLAIALQLLNLSESNSEKKILIVYSDLMENGPGLSFYNTKALGLIKSNPDSVSALLEGKLSLPSLKGIEVYFINQPLDVKTDEQYKVVSDFYRNFLESKGAVVHISANLQNKNGR